MKPETYAEQLAVVRQLASSDAPREWQGNFTARRTYIDPYDRAAIAAVLARLDDLDRPVTERCLSLASQEHVDLMTQFEREHKGRRLDREDKSLWPRQVIYQDGQVNELFLEYRKGAAYGWGLRAAAEGRVKDEHGD